MEQPESNDMRDVKAEPVDDAMPEHDLANVDQSVNATKASSPEPSPLAEDQESALSELEWEQFSEGAMTLTYVGSSEDVGTSGKKGKAKVNSIIETPEDGGKRTSGRKRPRYRNADEVDTTSGTPSKLSGRLESSSKRRSRGKRKE